MCGEWPILSPQGWQFICFFWVFRIKITLFILKNVIVLSYNKFKIYNNNSLIYNIYFIFDTNYSFVPIINLFVLVRLLLTGLFLSRDIESVIFYSLIYSLKIVYWFIINKNYYIFTTNLFKSYLILINLIPFFQTFITFFSYGRIAC